MILTLPLPPSNNVYYRHARSITYLSKPGRTYKDLVKAKYCKILQCHDKNIAIGILIHPKKNKDGTATKKVLDIDNYFKALFDSLKEVLYDDDNQIKRLDYVQYSFAVDKGAISMHVRLLEDNDSYLSGLDINDCYDHKELVNQ